MSPGRIANAAAALRTELDRVRSERRARWIATAIALGVGVLVAFVDPLGIVLGAMLVALPAIDPYRGLVRGLGFGLLVVGLLALQLVVAGALGPAIELGLPFYLAVGSGVGFGLLGGLVRGVV